jgi:hypothetical protein
VLAKLAISIEHLKGVTLPRKRCAASHLNALANERRVEAACVCLGAAALADRHVQVLRSLNLSTFSLDARQYLSYAKGRYAHKAFEGHIIER